MSNFFTLCTPAQACPDACFSIEQTLNTANIPIKNGSTEDHSNGLIFVLHRDKDMEWLYDQVQSARQQFQRMLVVWDQLLPLPGYHQLRLTESGVTDIIHWQAGGQPGDRLQSRLRRWLYVDKHLEHPLIKSQMAGDSLRWKAQLRNLIEVSAFSHAPVLILGESGTGKEMASRMIHHFDIRPYKKELVLLDCSSIAPDLAGSEFFGHEKGAFTNAVSAREGAFALADKGTLFLDEIGELPMHLQAELLRVTQEGAYKKLGSNQWQKTGFRLVSATNRNIDLLVAEKSFRQDLFYRISTWVCRLPPLRERREDIPCLVQAFLSELIPDAARRPVVDPLVLATLCLREYPGNVRELKQVVTRLAGRYTGTGYIGLGDLHESEQLQSGSRQPALPVQSDFNQWIRAAVQSGQSLKSIIHHISLIAKDAAIEHSNGNLKNASALLQVTDRTLQLHRATRR